MFAFGAFSFGPDIVITECPTGLVRNYCSSCHLSLTDPLGRDTHRAAGEECKPGNEEGPHLCPAVVTVDSHFFPFLHPGRDASLKGIVEGVFEIAIAILRLLFKR